MLVTCAARAKHKLETQNKKASDATIHRNSNYARPAPACVLAVNFTEHPVMKGFGCDASDFILFAGGSCSAFAQCL